MRRHTLLWTLVLCLTTAVVASASAARRDTTLGLAVRPSVTTLRQPVTIHVTGIDRARPEPVTVQFKECGVLPTRFRDVVEGVPFMPNEGWSGSTTAMANGTFRAIQGPNVSSEVRVVTRAFVWLGPTRRGRFRVDVQARLQFWRKRVRIERYDQGRARWVLLRTVVLDSTEPVTTGSPPTTYVTSRSNEFALKLPGGTKLRAVFPLSQAKPCYAAGYSQVVQT